jgi:hypothetical protein
VDNPVIVHDPDAPVTVQVRSGVAGDTPVAVTVYDAGVPPVVDGTTITASVPTPTVTTGVPGALGGAPSAATETVVDQYEVTWVRLGTPSVHATPTVYRPAGSSPGAKTSRRNVGTPEMPPAGSAPTAWSVNWFVTGSPATE